MAFKVVFCVFVVVGQSFAGPWLTIPQPSCDCASPDTSVPVYNCDGVAIPEVDSYSKLKSSSSKIFQSSYNKPISVSYSEENYKPISAYSEVESYKPVSVSYSEVESYKPVPVSYSEVESYKPISVSSSPINNNGGAMIVTSTSPIAPFGIGVASDLNLAGELELFGAVPYLSAVAFEGQFDTAGAAPVEYGCGDCVAITEEIGGNSGGLYGCGKY